jgi:hypothetical protein
MGVTMAAPIEYEGPMKSERFVSCWPAMKLIEKCVDRSELGNSYISWLQDRGIPYTTSRVSGYSGVCKNELVGLYIDDDADRNAFKLTFGL